MFVVFALNCFFFIFSFASLEISLYFLHYLHICANIYMPLIVTLSNTV